MKILQILGIALVAFTLAAGGLILLTKISRAQEIALPYAYEIVEKSQDPILEPGQPGLLVVALRNTGTESWPVSQLDLHSVYFNGADNRPSSFATADWAEKITPPADQSINQEFIRPRGTFNFYLPIQAPARPAIYQETFQLYLDKNVVAGELIKWIIQAGNTVSYQVTEGKQIKIWLADQHLWAIENGIVVMDTLISSGKPGYATPKGNYTVLNHMETAYSSSYHLWMDHWMALKSVTRGWTGYGLHALPHWKVKQGNRIEGEIKNGRLYTHGKLYEDYEHLGKTMSHGCVRVGIEAAEILYYWAPNGTPVTIVQ